MSRTALVLLALVPAHAKSIANPVPAALRGDDAALATLRDQGQAGLDLLLASDVRGAAWELAVDHVAQQRGAARSGLYWYTGLDAAKRAAADTGKPILSLRMLGELTDEYSCANSRFFRTVLYTHPEVAELLHDRFVLHWSSERPVPVATIDFGDGRVVKRTLTGNSAHYVLDAEGRPLDVLPGLYGPDAFQTALKDALALHDELQDGDRDAELAEWHRVRLDAAATRLAAEMGGLHLGRAVATPDAVREWIAQPPRPDGEVPVAYHAMGLAMTKAAIEGPVLSRVGPLMFGPDHSSIDALADATGLPDGAFELRPLPVGPRADEWTLVGASWRPTLPDEAIELIRREAPLHYMPKVRRPGLEVRMIERLEELVGTDTARNELRLHPVAHAWFANGEVESFEALNARVYDELFLASADDPWMGLVEPTLYTGLVGGGVTTRSPELAGR